MSGKRCGALERGGYVTRSRFSGREFTKAQQRHIVSQITLYLAPNSEAALDESDEIRYYGVSNLSRAII